MGTNVPGVGATAVPETTPKYCHNPATRVIASTLGVLVGVGSIDHGLLEIMQGNRPTPGLIMNALGPGYRWTVWKEGGEAAFTLVPNFLWTGLLATLLGVALICWSLRFLNRRYGPTIFLLLGVVSFLVGGGVAQVVLFTMNWAGATRIRASLGFWRWLIPSSVRDVLGRWWRWATATATLFFLAALEIAIVGYVPGVTERVRILHVCWTLVLTGIALFLVSFLLGFAHDLQARARAGTKACFQGTGME
jgi:hypothetical protein